MPDDATVFAATRRLRLLMEDQATLDEVWAFAHEGAPASKSRARWNRKRQQFYTPQETQDAEDDLAWCFKGMMRGRVLHGNVAIVAIFVRPNRQRIDADNLMKLVMDAATGAGVWDDDSQVTAQASYIEIDAKSPRTVVALAETSSSLVRGPRFICPQCGKPYERGGANVKPKFCSPQCRSASLVVRGPAVGQGKGRKDRPPAACVTCGSALSKRTYTRCRDCWRSDAGTPARRVTAL